MSAREKIVIVDYGSQFTQLIARRVREQQVFCTIVTPDESAKAVAAEDVRAIILSGGPSSVYGDDAPTLAPEILEREVPLLGICYGMQLLTRALGAKVRPNHEREYGRRSLDVVDDRDLFAGMPATQDVWMSHEDQAEHLDGTFAVLARTDTCPVAAIRHVERPLFGIQFHPEVHHTEHGATILRNFLFGIAGLAGDWRMSSFVDEQVELIRARVGDAHAICGLSGGVDSAVAAALVHRAIGDRLHCIFVDTGLLRKDEGDEVETTFRDAFDMSLRRIDASELFLSRLAGVTDPEEKRRIIGHAFIEVFEEGARGVEEARFLVQGTLYPDVIESVSAHGGPTSKIKSHHNVGGLPEKLGFELVEPLRQLFKDEVRRVGRELGVPRGILGRHPFPGPGLAVRMPGEVTREGADVLREADAIVREEIDSAGLHDDIWQVFAVLLPVRSVGVMGDGRTYENVCAVRAVSSTDGMTADWSRIPHEVLAVISNRIINEVRGINRVVYDISSKPPATIEWE